MNKPKCAVKGMVRPGAMCGAVIVGGVYCGHGGECEHKRTEYMPGSAICEHGFESGKDCDICYEQWIRKPSNCEITGGR